MIGDLAEPLENRRTPDRGRATLGRMIQHGKSVAQIAIHRDAELDPYLVFHATPVILKQPGQFRYVADEVQRPRNIRGKKSTYVRIFAQIDFKSAGGSKVFHKRLCGLGKPGITPESHAFISRLRRGRGERVRRTEVPNCCLCRFKLRDVSGSKNRTHTSTRKEAFNSGNRERCHNTRHSADAGPCVPIYYAGFSKPPALTYPVRKAHFRNPPDCRDEVCHESVGQ